jgi:hypothetical protein
MTYIPTLLHVRICICFRRQHIPEKWTLAVIILPCDLCSVTIDRFWIDDWIYWTLWHSVWLHFTVHCYKHTPMHAHAHREGRANMYTHMNIHLACFRNHCTLDLLIPLMCTSFCGLLWWLCKLFQHHCSRGRTHYCARPPRSLFVHIMHCTIGIKFVKNACNFTKFVRKFWYESKVKKKVKLSLCLTN